jgi:HlyD family secretion protein
MSKNPKTIFPKEVIGFSVESLLNKHSSKSNIIYKLLLLIIIAAVVSLPFIHVDVTLNGSGVVQSSKLQTTVISGITGKVLKKNVSLNQYVKVGDTLFLIDHQLISNQIEDVNNRITIKTAEIDDLNQLLTGSNKDRSLTSVKYLQSSDYLKKSLNDLDAQITIKASAWRREQLLFNGNASYKAKLEEVKLDWEIVKNQRILMVEKFKAQWNTELQSAILDLAELNNRLNQLKNDLQQYFIIATKSGFISDLQGAEINSFVYPNQQLCTIAPNEDLLLDCFIKPSDIGLIKNKQRLNVRVDAFNYQQWGMLEAEVIEIFNDVTLLNNQEPVFTVRCKPNKYFLQLKDGYKGELTKGMSFQANFIVANRSLFDLLFDKVDDWLAPGANRK